MTNLLTIDNQSSAGRRFFVGELVRRNDFRDIDSADTEISKTCLNFQSAVHFSLIVGFQKRKELIVGGK